MSIKDRPPHTPSKITARELLVDVLGVEHALHSVAYKDVTKKRAPIIFHCTCGGLASMPYSDVADRALANVPLTPPYMAARKAVG